MADTIATIQGETAPTAAPPRAIAADPATLDWAALREQYPEDDGQPMADNTKQYWYIVLIAGGLRALFRDDPDVFVAGNLLWYPVHRHAEIRLAPDAMVVFGRPKGDRGSYLQWLEGGTPPQVVFEVLSPQNTAREMADKRAFYERYGVEEYYEYDPDRGRLRGWRQQADRLEPIPETRGWVSPRLGTRFELDDGDLRVYRPDGRPFALPDELDVQREAAEQRAEQAEQRAEQERARAEDERARAERLAARLRALGIEPEQG